jgi:hypothetical protein
MGYSAGMGHDALARVSQPHVAHVTGAYSEHAKKKRYEHRREAWGDAHRAAGTHRENDTSRKRGHAAARHERGPAGVRGVCDS